MATLISDFADYIATQASLTVDIDLFIGSGDPNTTEPYAILKQIPGSNENYSGLEQVLFQLQVTGRSYVQGETLINTLYGIINHKPGFSSAGLSTHKIFYCEPKGMPYLIGRDDMGGYVWATNFILKKE